MDIGKAQRRIMLAVHSKAFTDARSKQKSAAAGARIFLAANKACA